MPKPSDFIKRGWCQYTMARDKEGRDCFETSPDAVAWCTYGAIYAAYPLHPYRRESILNMIRREYHIPAIGVWNDHYSRTRHDVLTLLEAIGE